MTEIGWDRLAIELKALYLQMYLQFYFLMQLTKSGWDCLALKYFLTLDLLKVTRVLTICFQLLLKIDRLYSGADDVDDKEKEREWDEAAGCGGCVVSGI